MKFYTVESATPRDTEKRLALVDAGGKPFMLKTHRFALVGKGDTVAIDPTHPRNVFTVGKEDGDLIRFLPHYEFEREVKIGDLTIPIRVHEPIDADELASHQSLEQFHYKTFSSDGDGDGKTVSVGGRKAVLLISAKVGTSYEAVGYIELHMPLLMVKPRHNLFDKGFNHPNRHISWDTWDQHAIRKHVNSIVRVARVVIHPEYRGLGLARVCLVAAKSFARERWQVGGVRPIFVEISAEMLNHIDFVSHAGFYFVGKTEGNLARVTKDLVHMAKGYDVSSGIMSLQKRYLSAVQAYCKDAGQTIDNVLARLKAISTHDDPLDAMTPTEWIGLRSALRFPIPYYLAALDDPAEKFLKRNLKSVLAESTLSRFQPQLKSIEISYLKVSSDYVIPQTRNVRLVLNGFGIQVTHLKNTLVGPLSIQATSGNIIFISGSSGTGKSVLLKALDPNLRNIDAHMNVKITGTTDYSASWLRPLPEDVPIFDIFAQRYSAASAMSAMSQVGLSEAFVFIKPFRLLSRGQRYRAMLADLLLRNDSVWLIDEFCADLDPLSARIVAHNLRRNVLKTGRIAFVAAANHGHFLDALRPTRVMHLRLGGDAQLMSYKDYWDEYKLAAS
jgi:ABC-type transport system involved in cytochrome c biogenesis ATPase subunit/GNAT superfamily N-acetyltransferase